MAPHLCKLAGACSQHSHKSKRPLEKMLTCIRFSRVSSLLPYGFIALRLLLRILQQNTGMGCGFFLRGSFWPEVEPGSPPCKQIHCTSELSEELWGRDKQALWETSPFGRWWRLLQELSCLAFVEVPDSETIFLYQVRWHLITQWTSSHSSFSADSYFFFSLPDLNLDSHDSKLVSSAWILCFLCPLFDT